MRHPQKEDASRFGSAPVSEMLVLGVKSYTSQPDGVTF